MALKAVVSTKREGGLNRRAPSEDMITGLMATTPKFDAWDNVTSYDTGDKATYEVNGVTYVYESLSSSNSGNQPDTSPSDWKRLGVYVAPLTSYEFRSVRQAEAAGITSDYDSQFNSALHYTIKEAFRMNPDLILWVRLAPRNDGSPVLHEALANKTNTDYIPQLLEDAGGKIRQCGILALPDGYSPVYTNYSAALPDDVIDAIYKAQELYDDVAFTDHRPCQFLIAGRGLDLQKSIPDLRDGPGGSDPAFDAEAVSVTVSADNGYANGTLPALGTLLGTVSAAAVSQNIGEVASFNIQDAARKVFLTPGLSDGSQVKNTLKATLEELRTKGYIYADRYIDFDGIYWNDSPTCITITSDYAYIEQQRTIDKAIRIGRRTIMQAVKSRVTINENTGYIAEIDRVDLENQVRAALTQNLENPGDASATDVYIPPQQDLINGELQFEVSLIGRRIIRTIKKSYGFEQSL